jgi:hypothetical protein
MEADPKKDLFAVSDGDPVRDWATLSKELEAFEPSLLKVWKAEYECWKHHYQRFRDYEQISLFPTTELEIPPLPQDSVMRLHRRALLALLQSGEKCAELLRELPLENDDAQERLDWKRRIRTLLESLQETLELWHPVNAERVQQRKAMLS